ncbi:serine hydrolase domain-containing protein [Streptomyces sp. NRRL S-241]|uniref:serine hydrolase domain-containing protein n=1 Tax=Streptomyces sp. NRRL S-241 TaxID=1463896 RepID=UPI0006905482|nr:serine hydrolase domain-containing protein [Streptomyces sp. NRRL S-241]
MAKSVPQSMSSRTAVQKALDRAVSGGEGGGLPGAAAEVLDLRGRWFGAAGVADTTTGRERLPEEEFRIGSTTKTFTAALVLQLAAEGVLTLDDTVEQWLPGLLRGNGHDPDRITLRHLLGMTGGVFNYAVDEKLASQHYGAAFLEHRYDRYRPEQLVEVAQSHAPDFAPGEGWTYSNTGYILAGLVIEKATGRSFADQVQERIARPLALGGTYVPGDDEHALRGPHTRLYSKNNLPDADAEIHDVTELNTTFAWAAGGMVSTTRDLNRFFGELLGGRLLPPAEQREMFAVRPTPEGKWIPHTSYGLGISSIEVAPGVTVWGMGGAFHGSFCYTYGTRDGLHIVSQSINADWNNPIGVFTEVLLAEFAPEEPAPADPAR